MTAARPALSRRLRLMGAAISIGAATVLSSVPAFARGPDSIADTAENRGNTGGVSVVGTAGIVGVAFCLRQKRVDLIEFGWTLLLVLKNGLLSAIQSYAAKQACFFGKVGSQRGARVFDLNTIAFSFSQLISMSRLNELGCLSNAIFDPKMIRLLCHYSWKWSSRPGFRTLAK